MRLLMELLELFVIVAMFGYCYWLGRERALEACRAPRAPGAATPATTPPTRPEVTAVAEEFDVDAVTNDVAKGIANIRQVLAPIEEASRGYRAEMEKNGWSPTVAEQMALQFHLTLMAQFMNAGKST